MVRGLYTAWTGMTTEQKRLDIITNNLANASTLGYKKNSVTNQSFDDVLTVKIKDQSENGLMRNIGSMNLGVKIGEEFTHHTQGSLRETGNSLDLAIEGSGFFAVNVADDDGAGQVYYTRSSAFTQTREGRIVDVNGNFLLGQNGIITLAEDTSDIAISPEGYVFADGQIIDQIQVQDFENYQSLEKVGDTLFLPTDATVEIEANYLIHQGFTEQSNVQVVSEMVDLISITRAYEANQKVIQTIDGSLELAANSVGKV